VFSPADKSGVIVSANIPGLKNALGERDAHFERSDGTDGVAYKCQAFEIPMVETQSPLAAAGWARTIDLEPRSKARRVRAFALMPCKHHANYYGIQSLFR